MRLPVALFATVLIGGGAQAVTVFDSGGPELIIGLVADKVVVEQDTDLTITDTGEVETPTITFGAPDDETGASVSDTSTLTLDGSRVVGRVEEADTRPNFFFGKSGGDGIGLTSLFLLRSCPPQLSAQTLEA